MNVVRTSARRLYDKLLTYRVLHNKSKFIDRPVYDYVQESSSRPDAVLADLAAETARLGPAAGMRIPPEQGTFLTMLTTSLAVGRAIELGTFTGYSALCIARGLPPGGHLMCLDINDTWTSIAEKYWARAGVSDRISLRLGPAAETIAALPEEPTFDLAFIDADKASYPLYFELLMPRMRANGIIVIDNVLLNGKVVSRRHRRGDPAIMRAFNANLARDSRVDTVMIPMSDGLTLVRKAQRP